MLLHGLGAKTGLLSTFPSSTPGGVTPNCAALDSHPVAGARRIRHPLAAAGVPYAPALADVLHEPRVQGRTLSPAVSSLPGALSPEVCEVVIEPHVPLQLAQTLGRCAAVLRIFRIVR